MSFIERLNVILNHVLDMETSSLSSRSFERVIRYELEKETFGEAFGWTLIQDVTLYEINRAGHRPIFISTNSGDFSGDLVRNKDYRWQVLSSLTSSD